MKTNDYKVGMYVKYKSGAVYKITQTYITNDGYNAIDVFRLQGIDNPKHEPSVFVEYFQTFEDFGYIYDKVANTLYGKSI